MSNNNDPSAAIAGLLMTLALGILLILMGVILLAFVAIFIIGWYLTHLVISQVDKIMNGLLLAEHIGLVLVLSGLAWALAAWLLMPTPWLYALASIWPAATAPAYLALGVGATLGLAWSLLVTFTPDRDPEPQLLDLSGMQSISADEWSSDDAGLEDLLADGIILGLDAD